MISVPQKPIPKPDPSLLSNRIKALALKTGFHKVGIVRADSLLPERERLVEWLRRGYHGEMSWMGREPERRTNPNDIFPAARSAVVVALNYYTPEPHLDSADTGKVSRYAWGDDYHDVMGAKLNSLLAQIQEDVPETQGKVCMDIQPTMDKAWAVRAGIGWLGKHSNVITPEFGSWVFIGELLLNLDLDYDDKVIDDHCGTCTLCIDACPTQAITEPYVVDSNLCISYATIELRTPELPLPVAENLDGWLYGCDTCQDVCPWNRFAEATSERRFEPRPDNINAKLQAVLELDHEQYVEKFRGSAMKRAKLAGLRRNARTLLDQSGADTS